jgi:hypothetical protein
MAPIKVRVAGIEYEVSTVNELAIFPMLRVFGTDLAPEDKDSKEYKKWQQKFLTRFADPINQASVAYSLRTIIPELPESVVKYTLYKEESGDRREDFVLNIGAMDLLALVDAISPLLNARAAELEGKPVKEKPKGFGGKTIQTAYSVDSNNKPVPVASFVIDDPNLTAEGNIAAQRAALQAQLAELETASEG